MRYVTAFSYALNILIVMGFFASVLADCAVNRRVDMQNGIGESVKVCASVHEICATGDEHCRDIQIQGEGQTPTKEQQMEIVRAMRMDRIQPAGGN